MIGDFRAGKWLQCKMQCKYDSNYLFQFVDDKISRKILSEARKQQEQLIEEIGIDRFVLLHQFMYWTRLESDHYLL